MKFTVSALLAILSVVSANKFLSEDKQYETYSSANQAFLDNPNLQQDLQQFRNKEPIDPATTSLVGMGKGTPIFTQMVEGTAPFPVKPVFETDQFMFVINAKTPYGEIDQDNAGMSFLHLLGLPKKRIYNAVEFTGDDQGETCGLLTDMRDAMLKHWGNKEFRELVATRIETDTKKQIAALSGEDDEKEALLQKLEADKEDVINNSTPDQLQFFFHLHPDGKIVTHGHSVGHLHLHVILKTNRYNFVHDEKSINLNVVLKKLQC